MMICPQKQTKVGVMYSFEDNLFFQHLGKHKKMFLKNSSALCNTLGKKRKKKADFYSDWEAAGTYAGDQAAC